MVNYFIKLRFSVFDGFIGNEERLVDVRQTSEKNGGFNGNKSYNVRGEGEQNVGTISWNPSLGAKFKQGNGKEGRISPSVALLHEMGHAKNASEGMLGFALRNSYRDWDFGNAEEASVITNVENPAAL